MEQVNATARDDTPLPAGEAALIHNSQADPQQAQAAGQQKLALEIAEQLFPKNVFQVISTEPDISGGFHFQLKTQKQDNGFPSLKPAFKQPRETERVLEALNSLKISFDHDQQKAKVQFDGLGTLKFFSYKELNYEQGNKPAEDLTQTTAFLYKGLKIERQYRSRYQSTYSITDLNGQQIGEGPYDQAVASDKEITSHAAQDGRQMPWFKTDAEIKREVDDILLEQQTRMDQEPQHLFAINKETGQIRIIGKDGQGAPELKDPEQLKKTTRQDDPPILEIIPHKGFLGNFILNFKNNYHRGELEILAVPGSKPLNIALQEIKQSLPAIRSGLADALATLKERTGISGLTDKAERAFISLPEEEQQRLLEKLEADTEGSNAYTLIRKNGRLQMPEEILPKTTFLEDLSNFIALLKDEELKYPLKEQPHSVTHISPIQKATKDMQQPKFDPDQINWKDAQKLGLTRELLERTGNLQRLLNGEKTTLFQGLKGDLGGVKVSIDGKFRLVEDSTGKPTFVFHGVKSKLDIPRDFLGYAFTEEDRKSLIETGSLPRQVTLTDKATRQSFQAYVGVDRDTNELVAIRAEKIKIPPVIKGVTLTDEQKRSLEEGKPVTITGMRSEKSQEFSAIVQIDAARKGLSFRPAAETAIRQAANQAEMVKGQQQREQERAPGKKRGGPRI